MNSRSGKKLFVIDGSSFLYRAYYGLRPLHTHSGEPVQAVYGFCRMIKKLIDTFSPDYAVLVWDSKGKTERHHIYPEYKATRQAPPSDLFEQKEHIIEFARQIGLFQIAQAGIEADDIIGSLVSWWAQKEGSVVVVSSDKDMGQLLTDTVVMYDSFKDVIVDADKFEEKMGFRPSQAVFYFSLLGDSSDNIPGVKGIGEKGALELVTQFKSLEDLYEHLDSVTKARTKKALEEHKNEAFLSQSLFQLKTVPLTCTENDVKFDKASWDNARPLFEKLEFKTFLKSIHTEAQTTLFGSSVAESEPEVIVKHSREKGYSFITVLREDQLDGIIAQIISKKCFAYDTEGYGPQAVQLEMVGLSICYEEKTSFYIPVAHRVETKMLSLEYVIEKLKPLFEDESIIKIAHNAKFDQLVLRRYGIIVKGPVFDTILAANLVKHEWQKASLKELSRFYLHEPMHTFKEVVEKKGYKDFSYVPLDDATEYGAADSHQTLKLYPLFAKMLKEYNQEKLFYDIEIPVMHILCDMEYHGIDCTPGDLKELDVIVEQRLRILRQAIVDLAGPEYKDINLNSPKQIEHLLFEHLQLPVQKKSAKRTGYSTDQEVLETLAQHHPVASYLLQYRELFKLQSTYIQALPTYINPVTGRIHTQYSQTRVATGRLSSSDPNLQNIPADGLGLEVRKAFKAPVDYVFLSVDYSQIELRVLAYLCQDAVLCKAFQENKDIHAQTAAGIFKVPLDQITKEQRNFGKRINFSIIYGLTSYGLSKDLHISLTQAKEYRENFFEHYVQLKEWMEFVVSHAQKQGYVETWYGRRRMVPGLNEQNKVLHDAARRIAINTVVQGTAAEIMKKGMMAVDEYLKKHESKAYIVLQIHDELVIAVPENDVKEIEENIKKILVSVVEWNVPLDVASSIGKTWFEVS